MSALPDLTGAPTPFLPDYVLERIVGTYATFDSGRGCPYQCSFCSIINVQGRKSRWRSPDDVEATIRENLKRGIKRFLITDDNFSRNKDWELVLDRMIKLREEEGLKFKFFIQADALCHKTPGFIEKCARAGCHWAYIGLENINPANLMAAKKRQNKIWEYRKMLQEWKKHGVLNYVGYITGFPHDTPETIARDVEIIKRELPVELIEFFYLTPLPGSEDHQRLSQSGTWMDPDMNKYALCHRVTHHSKMSDAEWEGAYRAAWKAYYNAEHVERIIRRAVASGSPAKKVVWPLLWFWATHEIEGVHPVEAGYVRLKVRTERRPGMPIENPLVFYPKFAANFLWKGAHWLHLLLEGSPDRPQGRSRSTAVRVHGHLADAGGGRPRSFRRAGDDPHARSLCQPAPACAHPRARGGARSAPGSGVATLTSARLNRVPDCAALARMNCPGSALAP